MLGNNSQPVEGAFVELLTAGNVVVASELTNSTGEAFFSDKKNAVQVKITHSDYEVSLKAVRENVNVQLSLKTAATGQQGQLPNSGQDTESFSGDVNQFIEIEQFGSFQVRLKQNNNLAINGVVKVFDAVTDIEITQTQSVGGIAVFENLPLNQHVYFHASAPGFLANRSQEFTVQRERQNVEIRFVPVQVVNTTVSIISSLTRQPLAGVDVKVFDEYNVPISNGTTLASGNLSFALPVGVRYYVNARKSTFVTNLSQLFAPVPNVVIALSPASPDAISTLRVRLKDEYNASLEGNVALYTSDNRLIEQSRRSSDFHEFINLPRNSTLLVKGSAMDLHVAETVTLTNPVHDVAFVLQVRFAVLFVSAVDALTGVSVNANVEVMRNGTSLGNCTS
ncbi:MAG: hypothetical protein AABZ49_01000, partial [Thermoproteota archaeon]